MTALGVLFIILSIIGVIGIIYVLTHEEYFKDKKAWIPIARQVLTLSIYGFLSIIDLTLNKPNLLVKIQTILRFATFYDYMKKCL